MPNCMRCSYSANPIYPHQPDARRLCTAASGHQAEVLGPKDAAASSGQAHMTHAMHQSTVRLLSYPFVCHPCQARCTQCAVSTLVTLGLAHLCCVSIMRTARQTKLRFSSSPAGACSTGAHSAHEGNRQQGAGVSSRPPTADACKRGMARGPATATERGMKAPGCPQRARLLLMHGMSAQHAGLEERYGREQGGMPVPEEARMTMELVLAPPLK